MELKIIVKVLLIDGNNARVVFKTVNDIFQGVFLTTASASASLWTAPLKCLFIIFATSVLLDMIVSPSLRQIFCLHLDLSDRNGLIVFQNSLLSVIFFRSRFFIVFFSFLFIESIEKVSLHFKGFLSKSVGAALIFVYKLRPFHNCSFHNFCNIWSVVCPDVFLFLW